MKSLSPGQVRLTKAHLPPLCPVTFFEKYDARRTSPFTRRYTDNKIEFPFSADGKNAENIKKTNWKKCENNNDDVVANNEPREKKNKTYRVHVLIPARADGHVIVTDGGEPVRGVTPNDRRHRVYRVIFEVSSPIRR